MSVTINFVEHPFMACAVQSFEAESVAAWLYAHYGERLTLPIAIYRGPASADVEVSPRDSAALYSTEPGTFTVLQSPAGPALPFIQAALIIFSVVQILNASTPTLPANVNRTSTSANNALGNRTNQPRVLQRVEDIIGTVRSTPSMMAQTYFKYINHRKVECGYYCVGRGSHNIDDVRDGDTPLIGITGSSAAFYKPFTSPNSGDAPQLLIGEPIIDTVLTVRRNNEVDGITLKALNQLKLTPGEPYSFEPDPAGDRIVQSFKRPNFNAIMSPGDEITVVMPDASTGASAVVTADATLSGFSGNFVPGETGGGEGGGGSGGGGEGGGGGGSE